MADKSIEQRVKDIIVEQLGVNADQVTPDAKFIEDLGAAGNACLTFTSPSLHPPPALGP